MPADVDVIVPVRRDTDALARLLDRLCAEDARPRRVIVVAADADGALRAAVAARAASRTDGAGCECILLEAPANRGAQLDLGARAAEAPILWFLHADAAPPDDALEAIRAAVAQGAESGCFRFEFQGPRRAMKRLLEASVALRVSLGGIPYGDQGIFATRSAYLEAGGFAHQPLFEEVGLVRGLRRRGSFRPLRLGLPVATRRWERDGWWLRTLKNRWLATCYMLGVPAERLSVRYEESTATDGAR